MKDQIRRIENELNTYGDIQDPDDIRFLISLAEKWAKVQEIYQDPNQTVDDVVNFVARQ